MADINLRIVAAECKTHTKFPVREDDTLVFHNDSDATLRVTVDKPDALIQNGEPVDLIKVDPRNCKRFTINPAFGGAEFKYTATIAGSETEDPIIIIERR